VQHIDGRIDGDEPEPGSDQDEAVAPPISPGVELHLQRVRRVVENPDRAADPAVGGLLFWPAWNCTTCALAVVNRTTGYSFVSSTSCALIPDPAAHARLPPRR